MNDPSIFSAAQLSQTIVSGVQTHLENLSDRFFPGYMLGHPVTTINGADLALPPPLLRPCPPMTMIST